ncbi:Uncharacterised protein [Mycobacterium tuberculosis]|nr:Uncharacterised protein [Mycobacterium tuberculosis]
MGRFGRPGGQQQHNDKGRRLLWPALDFHQGVHRALVWSHLALRCSRARDGCHPVRHRAARTHPGLRRHLPAVLRLHAPGGAAGGVDGHRHHLRLDARLDRPRRRRAHPSTDRAPLGAARDPPAVGGAPGRCQRDSLRLAHDPGPPQRQRAGRVDPDPPGCAGAGRHRRRGGCPRRLRAE